MASLTVRRLCAGCALALLACASPRNVPSDESAPRSDAAAPADVGPDVAAAHEALPGPDRPPPGEDTGVADSGTPAPDTRAEVPRPEPTIRELPINESAGMTITPASGGGFWGITATAIVRWTALGAPDLRLPLGKKLELGSHGLTTDAADNLWYTSRDGTIGRVTLGGAGGDPQVTEAMAFPARIVADDDGNMWVAESGLNQIVRVTPSFAVTRYPLPEKLRPWTIVKGGDGQLWFNEYTGPRIGRISTAGQITIFPVPGFEPGVSAIAPGPDGNLWFTNRFAIGRIDPRSTLITQFPIPSNNGRPMEITSGPDGNLWYTDYTGKRIGRATPQGVVTEFPVASGKRPSDIIRSGAVLWVLLEGPAIGIITF